MTDTVKKDNYFMQVYKHFFYKDGKFARHSFIMMTAWFTALGMAIAHYIQKGFDFDVFVVLTCLGWSGKVINALAEKILVK